MENAIVVTTKGKSFKGEVVDKKSATLQTNDIDAKILEGVDNLIKNLSGENAEPTEKKCSRCWKLGRVFMHPIEQFSIIEKTGKRHSQCKVCRTEQSNEWCAKRKEHRKKYHAEYNKRRMPYVPKPKAVVILEQAEQPKPTENALFVGFPSEVK